MTEIIKGKLYLGNVENANDLGFLESNNIDTIINVAYDGNINKVIENYKNVYKFNISDIENENISKYFTEIIHLIDSNKCVLVNCILGVSRSATIVIAYLMTKKNIKFTEAFNIVKSKRLIINPNKSFIKQLIQYEKSISKEITLYERYF